MKKTILLLLVTLAFNAVRAQCDKAVTWNGSRMEMIDSAGNIQKSDPGPVTVEMTRGHIKVNFKMANDQPETIEGDLKNPVCSWTVPYKEGKMQFNSVLAKSNGETRNALVQVEARDGRIVIFVAIENTNGMRIRIPVDNYKEKG